MLKYVTWNARCKRIGHCTKIDELERAQRPTSRVYGHFRLRGDSRNGGGEKMIGAEGSAINILVCGSFFGIALLYIIVDFNIIYNNNIVYLVAEILAEILDIYRSLSSL